MNKSFHFFIFTAAMLGMSMSAHAQVEPEVRNTVNLGGGYATLNTQPTVGEYSFSEKVRIVQEAKNKRAAQLLRDQKSLPTVKAVDSKSSK